MASRLPSRRPPFLEKVHFANSCNAEKASFMTFLHPGNWPFFASWQQGADIEKTTSFPEPAPFHHDGIHLSFVTNSISRSVGTAVNSEFLGSSSRMKALPGAASLGTRTGP
jgi:hypothetical protein